MTSPEQGSDPADHRPLRQQGRIAAADLRNVDRLAGQRIEHPHLRGNGRRVGKHLHRRRRLVLFDASAEAKGRHRRPGKRQRIMVEIAGIGEMDVAELCSPGPVADLRSDIVGAAGQRNVERAADRLLVAAEGAGPESGGKGRFRMQPVEGNAPLHGGHGRARREGECRPGQGQLEQVRSGAGRGSVVAQRDEVRQVGRERIERVAERYGAERRLPVRPRAIERFAVLRVEVPGPLPEIGEEGDAAFAAVAPRAIVQRVGTIEGKGDVPREW